MMRQESTADSHLQFLCARVFTIEHSLAFSPENAVEIRRCMPTYPEFSPSVLAFFTHLG